MNDAEGNVLTVQGKGKVVLIESAWLREGLTAIQREVACWDAPYEPQSSFKIRALDAIAHVMRALEAVAPWQPRRPVVRASSAGWPFSETSRSETSRYMGVCVYGGGLESLLGYLAGWAAAAGGVDPTEPLISVTCPHGSTVDYAHAADVPAESTRMPCGREDCWAIYYDGPRVAGGSA